MTTRSVVHIVEYIVYNTPGSHGYTPRDLDRRWSINQPLDRALREIRKGARTAKGNRFALVSPDDEVRDYTDEEWHNDAWKEWRVYCCQGESKMAANVDEKGEVQRANGVRAEAYLVSLSWDILLQPQ